MTKTTPRITLQKRRKKGTNDVDRDSLFPSSPVGTREKGKKALKILQREKNFSPLYKKNRRMERDIKIKIKKKKKKKSAQKTQEKKVYQNKVGGNDR